VRQRVQCSTISVGGRDATSRESLMRSATLHQAAAAAAAAASAAAAAAAAAVS